MTGLSPEQLARIVEIAIDQARHGATDELIEFLDHGLEVDTCDTDGQSLLMMAAYHGHRETVQALIDRGADVNLLNIRGQSPLAGTIFKGEDDVARMLLAAGADPDAGTPSARESAQMFGRSELLG